MQTNRKTFLKTLFGLFATPFLPKSVGSEAIETRKSNLEEDLSKSNRHLYMDFSTDWFTGGNYETVNHYMTSMFIDAGISVEISSLPDENSGMNLRFHVTSYDPEVNQVIGENQKLMDKVGILPYFSGGKNKYGIKV
jgi:hypothetical protein